MSLETIEGQAYGVLCLFMIVRFVASITALIGGVPVLLSVQETYAENAVNDTLNATDFARLDCDQQVGVWLVGYGAVGLSFAFFMCFFSETALHAEAEHWWTFLDCLELVEKSLLGLNIGWLCYGYYLRWHQPDLLADCEHTEFFRGKSVDLCCYPLG